MTRLFRPLFVVLVFASSAWCNPELLKLIEKASHGPYDSDEWTQVEEWLMREPSLHAGEVAVLVLKHNALLAQRVATVANDINAFDIRQDDKDILGTGLFGAVRLATHCTSGQVVAIKTVTKNDSVRLENRFPSPEPELMQALRHPNIIRLHHAFLTDEAMYLVMERFEGENLFDYSLKRGALPEDECRAIMRQLVLALDYLHNKGICHRDLKRGNVLINAAGLVKLIDFGLSGRFDKTGDELLSDSYGTPASAAPELHVGRRYFGPKVDVWGLGTILFSIATGQNPFSRAASICWIEYDFPPEPQLSEGLRQLITRIFRTHDERCSLEDMIRDPWMNNDGELEPVRVVPARPSAVTGIFTFVTAALGSLIQFRAHSWK